MRDWTVREIVLEYGTIARILQPHLSFRENPWCTHHSGRKKPPTLSFRPQRSGVEESPTSAGGPTPRSSSRPDSQGSATRRGSEGPVTQLSSEGSMTPILRPPSFRENPWCAHHSGRKKLPTPSFRPQRSGVEESHSRWPGITHTWTLLGRPGSSDCRCMVVELRRPDT